MIKPYYSHGGIEIFHADALDVLPELEAGRFDVVLVDPPYSSGGFTRGDRNQTTQAKYQMTSNLEFLPDFAGDNRDQLSMMLWCSHWMRLCMRASRKSAAIGTFIDWRNLSVMTNAVQAAGYILRNISVWDKTEQVRPNMGWFRQQAEFIVWGTAGPLKTGEPDDGKCTCGVFRHRVNIAEKQHQTQKPLPLLAEILGTRRDWKRVLDPFCGTGTTLRAAKDAGLEAVGIEIEERYCEIAALRMRQEVLPLE